MDSKDILSFRGEFYFVGCGYNRTTVRSYSMEHKKWTPRGILHYENKETYFKAITLNDSIYVVMCKSISSNLPMATFFSFFISYSIACFDSTKIYNRTEFHIQRYDENVEDWVVVS